MKIVVLLLLIMTTIVYSQQRIEYYNYGYDGMESVNQVRGTDSMLIYSNYESRPLIRREVCDSILKNYKNLKNGHYTVVIKEAKVNGQLLIERSHNFVSVKYYYERIDYSNGLVEIYKNPIIKKKNKKRIMKR